MNKRYRGFSFKKFIYKITKSEKNEFKRADNRYLFLKKANVFPKFFDIEEIIKNVSSLIGKTIQLHPVSDEFFGRDGKNTNQICLSGLTLCCEERVYIAYRAVGSKKNQLHIIFHEIAHLLLNHVGGALDQDIINSQSVLTEFLTKLNISSRSKIIEFKRTDLTSSQEREAERFAIRLMSDYLESKSRSSSERQKRWGF